MEKALLLKAEIREGVGTKFSKQLRKSGRIPATVYGHGQKPLSVALNTHDLTEGLHYD